MKKLLLFIVLFLPLLTEAQPAPTFEASATQTTDMLVGAPFYISPRRLGLVSIVATNLPLGTFTNVLNTYSNSVATNLIAFWPTPTNLVLFSGSNGPPVVGNTAIIVGTNANGSTVIKGTNAQSAINVSSNSVWMNIYFTATNSFVGNNFGLGTNTTYVGSSAINLSGIAGAQAANYSVGELSVVASGGSITITNPPQWNTNTSWTVADGHRAECAMKVQLGVFTNFVVYVQ